MEWQNVITYVSDIFSNETQAPGANSAGDPNFCEPCRPARFHVLACSGRNTSQCGAP